MTPACDVSQYENGVNTDLQEYCHFTTLAPATCGYVIKYIGNYKSGYVHRLIYEGKYGLLPKDRHLHHLCGQKLCVNPEHLISLTPKEHFRLHSIPQAAEYYRTQERCAQGHALSDHNGHRMCKTCRYERNLRWKNNPGVKERNIEVKRAWRAKRKEMGLNYA